MQSYLIILLISLCISSVQPQNWVGVYTADSTCVSLLCCCVSGQVVVTTVSTGFTSFTTGLSGGVPCGGATSYTTNITTPTGYVTTLTISIITLTFNLRSDSLKINVTSTMGASCGGGLTKNVAATATSSNSTASSFIIHQSSSKSMFLYVLASVGLMRITYGG